MKLTTVNAKKQGPKGETGESRLRPSHGQTGSYSEPELGLGKRGSPERRSRPDLLEARFWTTSVLLRNSPWSMSVAVWRLLALGANV